MFSPNDLSCSTIILYHNCFACLHITCINYRVTAKIQTFLLDNGLQNIRSYHIIHTDQCCWPTM